MKLVAYLRVSTIEQADKGYGLDVQREAIRKAAKSLGAKVVAWAPTRVRAAPSTRPTVPAYSTP